MKTYFRGQAVKDAKAHAVEEHPKESCGIIVDSIYHPCNNIAEEPEKDFRIHHSTYMKHERMGKIDCVIHSHNDYSAASQSDMVHQISSGVPWGVINLINGKPYEVMFWGDELPTQDFIGRPFHFGVYDCFSLVREIYRDMYNVILPNIPRDPDFFIGAEGASHFEEQMVVMVPDTLYVIDKHSALQEGDGLLFKMNSKVWNHCGIYIGRGLMVHHLDKKLSRHEPIGNWMMRIDTVVRPTKMEKLKAWN
jgi:cell wall-associated NlpC family hydrolase